MKNILIDENGDYGLEYTNAVWASDQMHKDYHTTKVPLADADFLLEDEKFIMIVEYKNANIRKARDAGLKTPQFNPMDDKKFASIVRKFYDSLHYVRLLEKYKPVRYIYVVETPNGDETMRKRLRDKMKKLLPFDLQEKLNTGIKLINKVDVLSIEEWNMHDEYGKYPFIKIEESN
ncbi:MAG: hypothetical protein K2N87_03415 [Eubacterium sp.]|nr:hypothetical protein [Eubacterium sp.]